MNAADLKQFETTLRAREAELQGLIRNREGATIETSADTLDQIQHGVERELALQTLARESASLRQARAALRRIADGVYGICTECEEEISLKRLAAAPWASHCLDCQTRADRNRVAEPADDESFAAA